MPDGGASLIASIIAATTAAAPVAGSVGATAATTALAAAPEIGAGALASGAAAAGAGGFGVNEALQAAGAVGGVAGSAAQLLAKKPGNPVISAPQRDQAALDADMRNELLKKRGRAASLLTPGGARGDTSSPTLGAAALLGSG